MERIPHASSPANPLDRTSTNHEVAVLNEGLMLADNMLKMCGCNASDYLTRDKLSQNPNPDILRHLINTARLAIEYVGNNPSIDRSKEYLGYPLNLLYLNLTDGFNGQYSIQWSPTGRILYAVGNGYVNLIPVIDPISKEHVSPQENIAETIRILDQGELTFNTLFFVTRADDKKLPIQDDGIASWKFITTKDNGEGVTFCDDPQIRFGSVMGEKFLSKVAVNGVHEVIGEECDPWHFYSCEWSVWKEGVTWAKRGRHRDTHPCEQIRFKGLLREKPLVLWDFEDLVTRWRECARNTDEKNSPLFAYYSGEIAFLTLAAYKTNDSEYIHEHYSTYVQALEEFCRLVRDNVTDYRDTAKPEVMLPLLREWVGIDTNDNMYNLVRSRIGSFSEKFLLENNLAT